MDLTTYDYIVINSSAGKDSQAMLDVVYRLAKEQGVVNRLRVVHADLKRVEWPGCPELANDHAVYYGIPFAKVEYRGKYGDFLDYIRARGKWPDSQNRYCTSDFKRGPVNVYLTELVEEARALKGKKHQTRILNCLGIRAQESSMREKMERFTPANYVRVHGKRKKCKDKFCKLVNSEKWNSRRWVDTWYPIFDWSVDQVWQRIRGIGTKHHPAYDLGMPRLSCMFCVFAPKSALIIAGRANPELLAEYVAVEKEIGHTFRKDFRIEEVQLAIAAGEPSVDQPETWNM